MWVIILNIKKLAFASQFLMEQVMGIEPTLAAWKAEVLPLNYICVLSVKNR